MDNYFSLAGKEGKELSSALKNIKEVAEEAERILEEYPQLYYYEALEKAKEIFEKEKEPTSSPAKVGSEKNN